MVEIMNENGEKVEYFFDKKEIDEVVNYIKSVEKRKIKVKVSIKGDIRKGGVYIAIIKGLDEKYRFKREFLEGTKFYDRKSNILYLEFDVELESGSLMEVGEGGSWKNKYRFYYIVTERGLELLSPPYVDGEKFIWEIIRKLN
jgi:hypothetical protein